MEAALAGNQLTELAQLAHTLKGSGGTAGFKCFTEPAAQLEQVARAGDLEQAPRLISQLEHLRQQIVV
jgi:HPt (histidine-containing phosphotransfer) domain-containing protein